MKTVRGLIVVAALAASVFGVSAGGASAACALDAQIAAQQAVITQLQAQLATATPREAINLNAQIAARQAAVADMQAQCA